MTFNCHACWTDEARRETLFTEATEGSEALFLARHTPVQGYRVAASKEIQLADTTERALLDALAGARNHAVVLVEGEPGSGKSHLIRWLQIRWPKASRLDGDEVALVPKSRASLGGALRHLRERLPAQHRGALEKLNFADTGLSRVGEAEAFGSMLATMLDTKLTRRVSDHTVWATARGIRLLLQAGQMRGWAAPGRVLQAYQDPERKVDRSFTTGDVSSLLKAVKGFSWEAVNAPRSLYQTLNLLREEQRENNGAQGSETKALLGALEDAVRPAMQERMGVMPGQFREALRELRRSIKRSKGRLILLLEDITDFQGIDEDLIEAINTRADRGGNDDICPLVAVVGVTPGFYQDRLREMKYLRDRVSMHIQLSGDEQTEGRGETRLLREPTDREAFVARYMNAARLGGGTAEEWRASSPDRPVPSACAECGHQAPCHETFGAAEPEFVEGPVGFYPFTKRAIEAIWRNLEDPERAAPEKTPRGIVQGLLGPTLRHGVRDLPEGRYPSATLDVPETPRPHVADSVRFEIQGAASDDSERVERIVAWWGEPMPSLPWGTEGDKTTLGAVPRPIFDAFGARIDWTKAPQTAPTTSTGRSPAAVVPVVQPTAAVPSTGPTQIRSSEEPEFRRRQESLLAWLRSGASLGEHSTYWNGVLFDIVRMIPWAALGVPTWAAEDLFSSTVVILSGTKRVERGAYFAVGPDKEDKAWNRTLESGLRAWGHLRDRPGISPSEAAEFFRAVSRLVDALGPKAHAHARRFLGSASGGLWSPIPALMARLKWFSWLTETATPNDAPLAQWWATIAPDDTKAAPGDRHENWRTALGHVKRGLPVQEAPPPSKLSVALRTTLRVGTGDGSGALLDAGLGWSGRDGPVDRRTGPIENAGLIGVGLVCEQAHETLAAEVLDGILAHRNALLDLARELSEETEGRSVGDYLRGAMDVLERISQMRQVEGDPVLPQGEREGLLQEHRRLLRPFDGSEELEAEVDGLEAAILSARAVEGADDAAPPSVAEMLEWIRSWPRETRRLQRFVVRLSQLVSDTHKRAKRLLEGGTASTGKAEVRAFGEELRLIASTLEVLR
jgi:hypothetical protein